MNEVADILTMWRVVEQACKRLSAEDKQKITDAVPFAEFAFYGFDGNNETEHMSIGQFLVDDLGRFAELKGRGLNSPRHTLPHYLGMLAEFQRIREAEDYGALGVGQLTEIFQAGYA